MEDSRFYTDDSMELVRRDRISPEVAKQYSIEREYLNQKSLEHSTIGLNAFPCTEGFAMTTEDEGLFGAALSRPATCHLVNKHTFELILARSLKNNDNKGVAQMRNIELGVQALNLAFTTGTESAPRDFRNAYNWQKEKSMRNEPLTAFSTQGVIPALKALEGRSVSYKFPGQTSLKMVHFSKDEDVATFLVSHVADMSNDFLLAKDMKERMPKQLAFEVNTRNLFPPQMPKSNMTFSRDFNLPINPPFSTFSLPKFTELIENNEALEQEIAVKKKE